ncbi:MAG: Phosphoribosylaminoimidazole-succinocarboxamide synthase [Syntrophaceae bacterium PtaU1.Bin231]|mgnify:CR=1 FL=1|nr:MAG: Phosphoribosylaminoimidazole-succinocarboxamide synthase [Syntrophaceae bacterium PtaU1.Bin231]HOG17164.1 phosphoribosylaminoimidazolesuccinocarboxamide synthase [Syntrophales bacterium]
MERRGLMKTDFRDLRLLNRGKVRDLYEVDGYLLMVATDRISAFDVIMPNPVPGKGEVLTRMSVFWFDKMKDILPNHLVATDPEAFPPACRPHRDILRNRSMLVKKAKPLPVECVVRGYLSGGGWKDYTRTGIVSGIRLPQGLLESSRLPEPIFTPSTKAGEGEHDQPIARAEMEKIVGADLTRRVIDASIAIYRRAAGIADAAGIIIADTKFEFGLLDGELILIDEVLTPDSSRFWPKDDYEPGRPQKSFDKQFLRDYLLSLPWNQKAPAPELPEEIVRKTGEKYEEALRRLVR